MKNKPAMRAKVAVTLLLIFPFSVFPLHCSLRDLETSDTLDVYLTGAVVGSLIHTASYDTSADAMRVSTTLGIAQGSGGGLSLWETRLYNNDGLLVKARQELKSASGVSIWQLDKTGAGWRYSATAGGAVATSAIASVNENMSSTCRLLSGIRAKTLKPADTWNDTAFELMSAQRIVTAITCMSVDSADGLWTFKTVDDISNRAEKQVLDSHGATLEQSIEGVYTAKAVHGLSSASASVSGRPGGMTDISDLLSIASAVGPQSGKPLTVLLTDSLLSLDESVSALYSVTLNRWMLKPLPSLCEPQSGPAIDKGLNRWLAPSVAVQSGHADIVNLSGRICVGKDPCARIGACNAYVFTSLKKRPTATFSNALETLHAGFGDCGEHAVLLTAILRAGGIPARVVLGLLYVESKKAYFYHAQIQAYTGQ